MTDDFASAVIAAAHGDGPAADTVADASAFLAELRMQRHHGFGMLLRMERCDEIADMLGRLLMRLRRAERALDEIAGDAAEDARIAEDRFRPRRDMSPASRCVAPEHRNRGSVGGNNVVQLRPASCARPVDTEASL